MYNPQYSGLLFLPTLYFALPTYYSQCALWLILFVWLPILRRLRQKPEKTGSHNFENSFNEKLIGYSVIHLLIYFMAV